MYCFGHCSRCTDSDRFEKSDRVVDEEKTAVRIQYSLDVDWECVSRQFFMTFNIRPATGAFAKPDTRSQGNSRR